MARESLVINTLDLMDGQDWDVDEFTINTPATVGENPTVPGRAGSIFRPKKHGPGSFTVSMWVGNPEWTRQQVWVQWEAIVAAVSVPGSLSTVTWTLSDGSVRTCQAALIGQIQPARIGTKGWRTQLEFTVPASYWTGTPGFATTQP